MIFFSNDARPFHFGPYPLERLRRDPGRVAADKKLPRSKRAATRQTSAHGFGASVRSYYEHFASFCSGIPAAVQAPVPEKLARRAVDIKGSAYFLDASQVGICKLHDVVWYEDVESGAHTHGVVILVEFGRLPEPETLAIDWLAGQGQETAAMRALEIAICIAGHIRQMGFAAVAHGDKNTQVDLERLGILAGLGLAAGAGLVNPFVDRNFALAAVTTDYELPADLPLARSALRARGIGYWLGLGGAVSGLERRRQAKRASHLSRYPMEAVRRVPHPTTHIFADEVPRVPKRAAFFERAIHGDLDEKARMERHRFAFKQPLSWSMTGLIRSMVPMQDGPVADRKDTACLDAAENARAVKSLSYFLGADLTGICEIPPYAWFSHKEDGTPIQPYHRYAVVMLIDQGYETMEGASGDDFISGAQSMRAYMRGGEIAGIMANHIRSLGFPARAQTNADSDLLHIPVILWAGLGELSRIGELVLNPYVGPRFKSVVLTTDMPLAVDQPIDFGLQYFCSNCLKCARECPCDAIPFGDKVIFNGYEIWKPDVERCARYRLTNQRGLACGRCMKTCPLNKVVSLDGPIVTQVASWLGIHAMWLKPLLVPIATKLDDWLGHGVRKPVKKWWLDLEIVDGICVTPRKGVNQRDINPHRKIDIGKHKVAYYHADMMPPPDTAGIPCRVVRKAGLAAAAKVETVAQALARRERGEPVPLHYIPTPPSHPARQAGKGSEAAWPGPQFGNS